MTSKKTKAAINSVNTEARARDSVTLARYVAGLGDDCPALATAKDAVNMATLANIHVQAETDRVQKLQGGQRAIGVALGLIVYALDPIVSKYTAGSTVIAAVSDDKQYGFKFSLNPESEKVQRAQVSRIVNAELTLFEPSNRADDAATIAEAFSYVRERLAKFGSFKAWYEASPKTSTKGRKNAVGKTAAKGEATAERDADLASVAVAASETEAQALARVARAAIKRLGEIALEQGDTSEAWDMLQALSAAAEAPFDEAEERDSVKPGRPAQKQASA